MKRAAVALLLVMSCSSGRALHVRGCGGAELPLVAFDASGSPKAAAVFITGDGGWRAIDQNISAVLRERGFTVTGFLANRYFRTRRTIAGVTCDLDATIREAMSRAHTRRVLVVGYSRGAETIAVTLPQLATRADVGLAVLLAPSRSASMHLGWFGFAGDNLMIDPLALSGPTPLLCFHGNRERDTLCSEIPGPAQSMAWPGGHHFAGDYRDIASTIAARWVSAGADAMH